MQKQEAKKKNTQTRNGKNTGTLLNKRRTKYTRTPNNLKGNQFRLLL